MRLAVWVRYWTALALMLLVAPQRPVFASPPECPDAGACLFEIEGPSDRAAATTTEPAPRPLTLRFFWGVGCPHCEHAKSFVAELERSDASLHVERWEVRQSEEGRRRFVATMRRLGAEAVGIPTFVVERQYVVGFQRGTTEAQVRRMIDAARSGGGAPDAAHTIDLPLVGEVNAQAMSLPALTIVVGLLDGINPCAIWVLLVLLGILMHVRSRPRLLLFGGTFVLMSGVVYFAFMTAWSWFFELAGLSRVITVGLGIAVTLMGLVNLKELVWFKRGPSLTIPDRAKPGLYRRMRAIAASASLPAALAGVFALAFVVNLIELGCTLGLPAVYTRILSLREISAGARYAYLALYNAVYIIPLALVVVLYALTMHRITLSERGAKVLKAVSGGLLVAAGLVFVFRPEVLH